MSSPVTTEQAHPEQSFLSMPSCTPNRNLGQARSCTSGPGRTRRLRNTRRIAAVNGAPSWAGCKQQPQIVIAQRRRRMSKKRITWRDAARNPQPSWRCVRSDRKRQSADRACLRLKIDHRSDGCRSPHRRQSQRDPDIFCNRPAASHDEHPSPAAECRPQTHRDRTPRARLHKSCQQIRKHRTDAMESGTARIRRRIGRRCRNSKRSSAHPRRTLGRT